MVRRQHARVYGNIPPPLFVSDPDYNPTERASSLLKLSNTCLLIFQIFAPCWCYPSLHFYQCSVTGAGTRIVRTATFCLSGSVADSNPDPPDPHVFGPPGSGYISQRYGSGSFYHQALNKKICCWHLKGQ
jgi:hypothetical protein